MPSMTWPESVDEALSFGWIDGKRRRIDSESYSIRFTPRRPGSIWSRINIAKAEALVKAGRMAKAGLDAFAARDEKKSAVYSYENMPKTLDAAFEGRFRASKRAWAWFASQPPWYRRVAASWVMLAKKPETRERRLSILIDSSAKGRKAPPFLL
jgi:uncharacterized protein YdeI (YjbR/CyaY-like superfamily)